MPALIVKKAIYKEDEVKREQEKSNGKEGKGKVTIPEKKKIESVLQGPSSCPWGQFGWRQEAPSSASHTCRAGPSVNR
jgi:hypothetical protein